MNILLTAFRDEPRIRILDASVSAWKTIDLVTNFVPEVTDFKPDIVHIMIGTNDLKRTTDKTQTILVPPEEYCRQLDYLLKYLTGCGARIVLSTLPPFDPVKTHAAFYEVNAQYIADDRDEFNRILRGEATANNCFLNDMEPVYAQCPTDGITEADGLHLNRVGQNLLVRGVLEKLIEASR